MARLFNEETHLCGKSQVLGDTCLKVTIEMTNRIIYNINQQLYTQIIEIIFLHTNYRIMIFLFLYKEESNS